MVDFFKDGWMDRWKGRKGEICIQNCRQNLQHPWDHCCIFTDEFTIKKQTNVGKYLPYPWTPKPWNMMKHDGLNLNSNIITPTVVGSHGTWIVWVFVIVWFASQNYGFFSFHLPWDLTRILPYVNSGFLWFFVCPQDAAICLSCFFSAVIYGEGILKTYFRGVKPHRNDYRSWWSL